MTEAIDSDFDQAMMRRCVELAQRARGRTAPNPMVGSVVVQDNEIVGEGFHPQAGQPHAEVFALQAAGERSLGATLYVNLEPCSHYGRTPPCADAVIQAGIERVVVGMVDPNPNVSGSGIARLRAAGISVTVGVEEEICQLLNEGFAYKILHQRPFGILKYAMTLDGKIAATTGHSAWVTTLASRHYVHELRAGCDAIVVGGNTVRQDNPLLTSHGVGHNPLRVVMTRRLELPENASILHVDVAPTLILTQPGTQRHVQDRLRKHGVEVVEVADLSPTAAMRVLGDRGLLSVLWECGGQLAAQAIADGSVQKVLAFIAPKIIGGSMAPSPVGDLGLTQMTEALMLQRVTWRAIESDLLVEGYLKK